MVKKMAENIIKKVAEYVSENASKSAVEIEYFVDAGTTWTKILKVENGEKTYGIIPSAELKTKKIEIKKITGHTTNKNDKKNKKYENEVVALAHGAKTYLEQGFTVLDLGSRDAKWVKFKDKKFADMDWNTSCAAATGATIEMLLKFYDIDVSKLKATDEKYVVTCGVFGLEKIMDDVSSSVKPEIAVSKFIHGIAKRTFDFAKCPDKIALSGGFCENKCFVESLKKYAQVELLGRFVLVDGLCADCNS